MIITTEHGTKFEINTQEKTWARIDATGDSGNLRDESGTYISLYSPSIGQPMTLLCPPRVDGALARMIRTANVVKIEWP